MFMCMGVYDLYYLILHTIASVAPRSKVNKIEKNPVFLQGYFSAHFQEYVSGA